MNDHGKSLFKPWLSVQNVTIGLSIAFLFGLAIRRYELSSNEIAAWVQAVGSVAAIFTAIVVAHRDSSLRQKSELNSRKGGLVRALAVTSDAIERVESAFDAANNFGTNSNLVAKVTSHLEQCLRYLTEALSVQGLDSDIYAELFSARKAVEDASLLLPGIGHIDTAPSEAELVSKLTLAYQKLMEMQTSSMD